MRRIENLRSTGFDLEAIQNRIIQNLPLVAVVLALFALPYSSPISAKDAPNKNFFEAYQLHTSTVLLDASDKDLVEADKIRLQSLRSTYGLLRDKSIPESEKFELYLRLGQVHLERHDFLKHAEMRTYEKKHAAYEKKVQKLLKAGKKAEARKLKEPQYAEKASKGELRKSIAALKTAIKKYPKERRLDVALFTMGQSHLLLKEKIGKDYLVKMIKKFPKSTLIPDANLAVAEFLFEKNQVKESLPYYSVLLKHKDHKGYLYAVYKMGWANYKLSFDEDNKNKFLTKALAGFKLVIRQSEKQKWSKKFNLREEALNDIVKVFAEIGEIEPAREYFMAKNTPERFYFTVMSIGEKLTEAGKNKQAVEAYDVVRIEDSKGPHITKVYRQIIKNHESTGQMKEVNKTFEDWASHVGRKGMWFQKESGVEPDKAKEAFEEFEKSLHHYSTKYHKLAQKASNKNFLLAAAQLYKLYLSQFDDTARATEIRFYLADTLLGFKKYEQSGSQFMIVFKSKYGEKYKKEALDNALYSFEGALETAKFPKTAEFASLQAPEEIPELKKKYLDALESLVIYLPKDKRLVKSKHAIASILYDYGHYDNALEKFVAITKDHPKDKLADSSAKLKLRHHFKRKEWKMVIAASSTFLSNKQLLTHKGLKTFILNLNKDAYFNYAAELEEEFKYVKSAELFVRFQKLFPSDANADKALYNASINFQKGGETLKSIAAGKRLISVYPKSSLTKDMNGWIAETLESIAKFKDAVYFYKKFHSEYPNDRRAREYLYSASLLSNGLGEHKEAADNFAMFLKFYPKDDRNEEIQFTLAGLYLKLGKPTKSRKMYEAISYSGSTNEKRFEAKAEGLKILLSQDRKSGLKRLRSFASQLKSSKDSVFNARQIVAEELLANLEPEILAYNKMRIKDGENLTRDIKAKNDKLVEISLRLQEISSIGVSEHGVAALYILGDLHENIAKEIKGAPFPKDITPEERNDIQNQLVTVSEPLLNDAKNFFVKAYETSQMIQTFSDWSIKATRKMKEISSETVIIAEIETVKADYLSHDVTVDESTEALIK